MKKQKHIRISSIDNIGIRYNSLIKIQLFVIVIMSSFIVSFICLGNKSLPFEYSNLWMLPMGHAIITFVFFYFVFKNRVLLELPSIIIFGLYYLRNVLTPLTMAVDNYLGMLPVPDKSITNIAIGLMLYETICVFITVLFAKKLKSKKTLKLNKQNFNNKLYWIILFIAVVIGVLTFLLIPQIKMQYYTIFTSDMTHLYKEDPSYTTGFLKALYTGGNMIIEATRFVLSATMIVLIRKKGDSIFKFIMAISIAMLQLFFMTDSNVYIIMVTLALLLLVFKLFYRYRKVSLKALLLTGIAFFILIYINRFSQDHYGSSISKFMQAYLPGIINIGGIFRVPQYGILGSIKQIIVDLYAAIPFRSTLFGYSGDLVVLSNLWNMANGVSSQIMPNIAQSYYYFGYILSPILSCFIAFISIRLFKIMKYINNPIVYAVISYIMMYTAVAPAAYNFYIFSRAFTNRMLLMLIMAKFSTYAFDSIDSKISNGRDYI